MNITPTAVLLIVFTTLICPATVNILVWNLKREKRRLTHKIQKIYSNDPTGQKFCISLSNDGNRPVEDICIHLEVPSGEIITPHWTPPEIVSETIIDRARLQANIPFLNPKEKIILRAHIHGTSPPIFLARACGVSSRSKTFDLETVIDKSNVAVILYMLGLIGVGAGVLFASYQQALRNNLLLMEKHQEEQKNFHPQ
ncbi:MAG: hypothetical protein KGI37_10525 [Alphaproteobacteria bacterium]|nr:hypothetical protein [Alphaproteobacteria bacterium]